MPAIRSPKGKAADNGQAAAPATGTSPRPRQKDNVDPCEICGFVVSRKSDLPRHAKIHASDADKLSCTWEGCDFKAWQKSNLETHYRRHTKDRPYLCKDDPECKFDTADPASLLRHRKRLHGYIPRSSVKRKEKKPAKKVSVRIIRGIEGDKDSVLSQFSKFSSVEASTSGSSSSRGPMSPMSPPESLSPSPTSSTPSPTPSRSQSPSSSPSPSPPPSRSYIRSLPRPRSFSPLNSSGESEVSLPSTPIASASNRQLTPEQGSSPTVLFTTSSPVYLTGKSSWSRGSLLFSPTKKSPLVDHRPITITADLLDDFLASSAGSEMLRHLYPEEAIYDLSSISMGDEYDYFPLPPSVSPDVDGEWPEDQTMGCMNGLEGLKLDMQQSPSSSFETTAQIEHPINGTFIQSHNFLTGDVEPANCRCSEPSPTLLERSNLEPACKCNCCGLVICFANSCDALADIVFDDVDDMSLQVDDGIAGGNQNFNVNLDIYCGYNNNNIGSGGGGGGGDVSPHHVSGYANMFDAEAEGDLGGNEELGLNLLQL